MKKKLNKFNQEDIDTAIKSFDDAYAKLTLIYKYILEFSSNKNIEFQKALEKNINQWVEEIEGSKAYSVLIEIFGIGYENSEKIPSFLISSKVFLYLVAQNYHGASMPVKDIPKNMKKSFKISRLLSNLP